MIVVSKSNKLELVLRESKEFPSTCTQNNGLHGPMVTDNIRGEILCGSCGSVLEDKVEDLGPEQRSYTQEQYNDRTRTGLGSTLTVHDKGLATVIGLDDKDASGNSLSPYMKDSFNRLRTWDSRSKSNTSARSMRSAFGILDTLKSKLDLSEAVTERAAYLYRKAISKKVTSGRSIAGIILASIYTACREANVPRTLQDVAVAGNITVKDLSRSYRVLLNVLDLKVQTYDSSDFVNRISESVGSSEKTKREALDILSRVKEKGITAGKNPLSLASAALFLSCVINNEKSTQKNIANASGMSSVTIRNVAKAMRKSLNMN